MLYRDYDQIGNMDEYGNYSHALGEIQRNKADTCYMAALINLLSDEHMFIGTVLGPVLGKLITYDIPKPIVGIDVTACLYCFSAEAFVMFGLMCFYVSLVLQFATFVLKDAKFDLNVLIECYLKQIWYIICLIVDQEASNFRE